MSMSEQQEHYIHSFVYTILDLIDKNREKMTNFELVGALEAVKSKITFETNVAAAAAEKAYYEKHRVLDEAPPI